MMHLTDANLIQEFQANNSEAALGVLFERHHGKLFLFFHRALRDIHTAEDLVHDTFLTLFECFTTNRYREQGKFQAWMYCIAGNIKNMYLNRKSRMWILYARERDENEAVFFQRVAHAHTNPSILERIDEHAVEYCIAQLSPVYKRTIELNGYGKLNAREIAYLEDIPENTAKTRIFYARQSLRELLHQEAF